MKRLPTDFSREVKGRKSLTLPNEAYSIQELLIKYSQGILPAVGRATFNGPEGDFDSPDLESVRRMDPVEQDELLNTGREAIARTKEQVRKFSESRKVEPTEGDAAHPKARKGAKRIDKPEAGLPSPKGGSKLSRPDGDE